MRRLFGLISFGVAVLAMALTAAACGDDDSGNKSTGAATFVGKVAGTQLAVAAVVEGDKALVYLCDGKNGRRIDATLTKGSYKGDVAGLGSVTLNTSSSSVTGTVDADGKSYKFDAQKATGKAALLWATGDSSGTPVSAGWIVAADGSETGGAVKGIKDGTSNIALQPIGTKYVEQDNIIAILIGVRAPIVRP